MTATVRLANADDIAPLAASLSRAFVDDPVMSYLLGTDELPFEKGVKFFTLMTKMQLPHEHSYVTEHVRGGGDLGTTGEVEGAADRDPEGDARASSACSAPDSSCQRSKHSTCSRRTTRRSPTTTSSSSAPIRRISARASAAR